MCYSIGVSLEDIVWFQSPLIQASPIRLLIGYQWYIAFRLTSNYVFSSYQVELARAEAIAWGYTGAIGHRERWAKEVSSKLSLTDHFICILTPENLYHLVYSGSQSQYYRWNGRLMSLEPPQSHTCQKSSSRSLSWRSCDSSMYHSNPFSSPGQLCTVRRLEFEEEIFSAKNPYMSQFGWSRLLYR